MSDDELKIVDWVHFERSRAELGAGFIRILSYFREDGAKSVAQIEEAMHDQNTAALVLPASGTPSAPRMAVRGPTGQRGPRPRRAGQHRRRPAPFRPASPLSGVA